jgi:hypothetical protein
MKKLETRHLNATLRAAQGNDFALVGYAARFNSPSKDLGSFVETILPGAFTTLLASNPDVKCTFNHSASAILGRTAAGTLSLAQDDTGLKFRCQLDRNQSTHRDLHSAVQRRDITGTSFAFALEDGDDVWTKDGEMNLRTIRNVSHLMDVAIVTTPAYSASENAVQARSFIGTLFPAKSFEQILEEERGETPEYRLKYRAARQAAEIRRDSFREEMRDAVRRRDSLWNDLSADGRLRLRQYIEARYGATGAGPGDAGFGRGEDGGQCSDPTQSLRCGACTLTATRDDHSRAVSEHRQRAKRCEDSLSASKHFAAADAHQDVVDSPWDEYACRANNALMACRASFENIQAGMKAMGS